MRFEEREREKILSNSIFEQNFKFFLFLFNYYIDARLDYNYFVEINEFVNEIIIIIIQKKINKMITSLNPLLREL